MECIETGLEELLLADIMSGKVGIESRDWADRTPLMVAVEFRKTHLVNALLGLGASAGSKSDDGETCLSRAIDGDDFKSLTLLVESGADIEQMSSGYLTPLSLACVRGNVTMVEYLLKHGANLEARGEMKETPLIEAAFFGQAQVVAVLLGNNADRTAKNAFGQTALEVARERGWPNVVAALSAPPPRPQVRSTGRAGT